MDGQEKIAIITDSCADVPPEVAKDLGIRVIPLQINYRDASYLDGVDIQPDEVYTRFSEEVPKTSTPSPASVMAVFDEVAAAGFTHVIVIAISSGLSATHDLMRSVAAGCATLKTEVVDTKSIGMGAGIAAIAAAECLASGMTFAETVAHVRKLAERTKVFFCVDTLDYLYQGGRIGKVTYSLGSKLNIRPIITCDEQGVYTTVAKAHGRKASLKKAVALAKRAAEGANGVRMAVVHGAAEEEARAMFEELKAELPHVKEWYFGQISPALVVHTGPGLVGVGAQVID